MDSYDFPYFPAYPSDFLSSSSVMAMDLATVGAHWKLICISWHQNPVGSIPADDELIADWLHIDSAELARIKPKLLRAWKHDSKHGRYYQERVVLEYQKLIEKKQSNKERAKLAADARWGRNKSSECSKHATSMQQACSSIAKHNEKSGDDKGFVKENSIDGKRVLEKGAKNDDKDNSCNGIKGSCSEDATSMLQACSEDATSMLGGCYLELDNKKKAGARVRTCEDEPSAGQAGSSAKAQEIIDTTPPCSMDECIFSLHNAYGTENIEILRAIAGAFYDMHCRKNDWKELRRWQAALRGFYEKVRGDEKYKRMEDRIKNDVAKAKMESNQCEMVTICLNCWRLERECECVVPDGEDIIAWRAEHYVAQPKPKGVNVEDFLAGVRHRVETMRSVNAGDDCDGKSYRK